MWSDRFDSGSNHYCSSVPLLASWTCISILNIFLHQCGLTLLNLLEEQRTTRASIRTQTRMSLVWFESTEHAWATEHYKMEYSTTSSRVHCGSTLLNSLELVHWYLLLLCSVVQAGLVRCTRVSMRPQARISMVWFDHTKPAWATQHYKSKYQATSSLEFGVDRNTSSHYFSVVWS